jgi:hypothetical protein
MSIVAGQSADRHTGDQPSKREPPMAWAASKLARAIGTTSLAAMLVVAGCGPGLDSFVGGSGGTSAAGRGTGGSAARASGGATAPGPGNGTGTGGASSLGTGGNSFGSGGAPSPPAGSGGATPGTGGPRGTGGAGTAASGGSGAGSGATGASGAGPVGTSGSGPAAALLPTAKETCPPIKSGNMTFMGQPVTIWAGTPTAGQQGPMVIYWFATGSNPQEALRGLGQAAITEITSQGGIVAAPGATSRKGTNTGNGVWFTGDFDTTDEVVACAIEQLHIDTRRIHAAGFSAGGLQTAWMSYARSAYLASVVTYSGGTSGIPGATTLEDQTNVPSVMAVHGAPGSDVVVLDFATASANYEADIKKKGGFAIDCNHGGGHMIPSALVPSTWTFMKAHPFHVAPEPYAAGIPATFPTYCKIP